MQTSSALLTGKNNVLVVTQYLWLCQSVQKIPFEGVVDLLEMKAIIWDVASQGMKFEYAEIPADLVDTVDEWRNNMVEGSG